MAKFQTVRIFFLAMYALGLIFLFGFVAAQEGPLVELPTGTIRGRQVATNDGQLYLSFQEIPYATPPVGNLRFQEPLPPQNWSGILDTTSNTKICNQNAGNEVDDPRQSEDCLYLNVYTPVVDGSQADLPVYVFIHGGGFQEGDGTNAWGPLWWVTRDIILVTINYRLGPFGFLNTEDRVIPANNGLKDQVLALKWVNENIHLFGGDKDKVTIGGHSAGAASVGYLIISPLARGLFRAGIMESGSALCAWSYQRRSRQAAYDFARLIDPSVSDNLTSQELLEFFQSVDEVTLRYARLDYQSIRADNPYVFSVIIEDEHENAFLTENQDVLLQNGDFNRVPILVGIASEEEVPNAANLDWLRIWTAAFDDDLSLIIHESFHVSESDMQAAGEALRRVYTNGGLFQDYLGDSVRYISDTRFTTAIIRHAALQARYTDVYFYQFSYAGELGNAVNYSLPGIGGTISHGGELGYLWDWSRDLNQYSATDVLVHERMVGFWENFIKTLNPTPTVDPLFENLRWPVTSETNFRYVDIDANLTVKLNPKEYIGWRNVTNLYGNPPFDTY